MTINTKLILLLAVISCASSYAQTIINAERLIDTTKTNIYSLNLAYCGTSGNLQTTDLDISPTFILIKPKNEYKIFGGYSFQSANGASIQNSGFAHIRHNYKLSQNLKTFEFFQIQKNDILLLENRIVFGAGLRYTFAKKDSLLLNMELGLMREIENLDKDGLLPNELDKTKNYRITNVYSFKYILSKLVSINNVIYYQPNIKAFNDYRILNDFNLMVSLSKHIDFIAEINTRYDSKPPGLLKSLDNSLSVGLNLNITN